MPEAHDTETLAEVERRKFDLRRAADAMTADERVVLQAAQWVVAAERERDELAARIVQARAGEGALREACERLAADLQTRRDDTWARYMSARGAASQALWQGRYDELSEVAALLRAVLAETGQP